MKNNNSFNCRLKIFNYINKHIKNESTDYYCKIKKIRRLGSSSKFGEAYVTNIDNIPFSIKRIKFTRIDLDTDYSKGYINREINSLLKINKLVMDIKIPNLPLMYNYFVCNDCSLNDKNVSWENNSKSIPCVAILNEYANFGTLKNWATISGGHSTREWLIAYFQIFVGLYCIHNYLKIAHCDLHWGNVLVKKIKKGGYFKYIINNKIFMIPNNGYLFTLWDFGKARSENFGYNIEEIKYNKDYTRILRAPDWTYKDSFDSIKRNIKINKDIMVLTKDIILDIQNKPNTIKYELFDLFYDSRIFKENKKFKILETFIIN